MELSKPISGAVNPSDEAGQKRAGMLPAAAKRGALAEVARIISGIVHVTTLPILVKVSE